MQRQYDPYARTSAGGNSAVQSHPRAERDMVYIVRRALRESCAETMLHRRILSEARRAGFIAGSGMFACDELIRTVAERLTACLAGRLRTSRGAEETVRD